MKKLSLYRLMLNEGGLGGHIQHVYDDMSLTFHDLKRIIYIVCDNKVNIEEEPRLKTDGQNMFVSYINDKLRFARNKSQAKNYGKNSLTIDDIIQKWADKPSVADAFSYAYKVLLKAFSRLDDDKLNEIFDNGKRWLNIEIIYSKNPNTILYNSNYIVFHDIENIDIEGVTLNVDMSLRNTLYSYLEAAKAVDIDDFEIKNNILQMKNIKLDFKKYTQEIDEIKSSMSDRSTIGEYIVELLWSKFRDDFADIDDDVYRKILHRLVYSDKSVLSLKSIDKKAAQTLKYIEAERDDIIKFAVEPISILFSKLAVEALQNVVDFLITSPNEVIYDIAGKLKNTIKQVNASGNKNWNKILEKNITRISNYGGLDMLSATEGFVFKYKNKYYKMTGLFAPINAILGIIKYNR
jgi:hypothetical protein